jgi:probable addiction module antidote protein
MNTKRKIVKSDELTNYEADVLERLQDDDFMLAYINDAASDVDPEVFLLALRKVVTSRGGFEQISEGADIGRTALYHMLSENGNPRYDNLRALLEQLGLKIRLDAA